MATAGALRFDGLVGDRAVTPRTDLPIVVVGAHRSGTSLTARVLAELGVFVGSRLDGNAESTFMQRLNRNLMRELGAHWSNPLAAVKTLEEVDDLDALVVPVANYVAGAGMREFWGRHHSKGDRPSLWGWKDPRNGLLLPIWHRIYPDAPLVWVRRHPADTARSLHRRVTQRMQGFRAISEASGLRAEAVRLSRMLRGQPMSSAAWRASTPAGAMEISLEYAECHEALFAGTLTPVGRVEYADLVTEPKSVVQQLADALSLPVTSDQLAAAASLPTSSSLLAYRSDPIFRGEAERTADRLGALGYEP